LGGFAGCVDLGQHLQNSLQFPNAERKPWSEKPGGGGMTQASTYEQFHNFRDEDLLRIAHSMPEDGFEPEAVKKAQGELDKRNISYESMSDFKEEDAREREQEKQKSDIPLTDLGWIAFVLVGVWFPVSIGASIVFYTRGYRQKSRDVRSAILASVVLYGLISAAMAFLAP
jgi:hypothetical protein